MGRAWRGVAGAAGGTVAALVWSVALAIYQPLMEPSGSWTDPQTGEQVPNMASNNTYWPRDVRQTAILLAFAAVILLARANLRAILVAAAGTAGWLAADLMLDRFDVSGSGTAVCLGAAALGYVALLARLARRLAPAEPGGERARHFVASILAVVGALALLLTTPYEEPVTDPALVRIENAVAGLSITLAVACAAVVAALIRPARWSPVATFAAVAALAGAALAAVTASGLYAWAGALGLLTLPAAGAVAVAAARDTTWGRLLLALFAGVVLTVPAYLFVAFTGIDMGTAMTAVAADPPVNGADEDLSTAFAAALSGLLLAGLTRWLTGPAFRFREQDPAEAGPAPAPTV